MKKNQYFLLREGLSILLIVTLVITGLVGAPIIGQTWKVYGAPEDDFMYDLEEDGAFGDGAYIYGYADEAPTQVVFPEMLEGKPVVAIDFWDESLQSADFSNCTFLRHLALSRVPLRSLDLSGNLALEDLTCVEGGITTLDLSSNLRLRNLMVEDGVLQTLTLGWNPNLLSVKCENNQLTNLETGGLPNLTSLDCSGNQLDTLNVSANQKLSELYCMGNRITKLDLGDNPHLETLWCNDNFLKSVDLTGAPNLGAFACVRNRFRDPSGQKTLIARFGTNAVIPQNDENELTVVGGTGSGVFKTGYVVRVAADPPPPGMLFDGWVTETSGVVGDPSAMETTVTMPANHVKITAAYKAPLPMNTLRIETGNPSQGVQNGIMPSVIWTGRQIVPSITVKNGETRLTNGVDYTVSFGVNQDVGKGSVTLTGIGGCTGAVTLTFNILPKKMAVSKLTVRKGRVKATWKKADAAQKLTRIQLRWKVRGGKKWTVKNLPAGAAGYVITKLKKGKVCQVQIRSFRTVDKTNYYSDWSALKSSGKVK